MIPVIGVPIVNGISWLERLTNSIDFPVKNLFVINNSGSPEFTKILAGKMSNINNEYINQIFITNLPSNLGVAGAWNLIIKSYMLEPYWVISNHDIGFTPGFLEELYNKAKDDSVGMIHGSGGDFGDGSYDFFLIKDWVIQQLGLFDENCYPAYCEDVDYIMRITRWNWNNQPNKFKRMVLETPYFHGVGLSSDKDYYHGGSQTKKHSSELCNRLDNINIVNFEYMNNKWGDKWRMTSPSMFPMNIEGMPLTYTSYDLNFVRKKHLGF